MADATSINKSLKADYELGLMYGAEPIWDGTENQREDFKSLIIMALNWANGVFTNDQLKKQTLEYLISKDRSVGSLDFLDDWKFINVGKTAWLLNNGCPLDEKWINRLETNILELQNDANVVKEEHEVSLQIVKPSKIQSRSTQLLKKTEDLMSFVEDLIDEAVIRGEEPNDSQVYNKFTSDKLDEKIAKVVFEKLNQRHKELVEESNALEKLTDEQKIQQFDSEDAFQNYAQNIELTISAYITIVNQVASYLGNKKSIKKSERKFGSKFKAKRIEQQTSNLNFKVQDSEYKVVSVNPTAIVGSQTLLAFNTKTRKLAVYVAENDEGLNIKGTTLQNFDENKSTQKIIKDKNMLIQIQAGNLRRTEVLLNGIKAKFSNVNGRINNDTILLKVFKEKYGQKTN